MPDAEATVLSPGMIGAEAAEVHGISDDEIAQGPDFVEAWARFLQWTDALLNTSVQEDGWDTDEDEPRAVQLTETPVLLLAAHNGVRPLASVSLDDLIDHMITCAVLAAIVL